MVQLPLITNSRMQNVIQYEIVLRLDVPQSIAPNNLLHEVAFVNTFFIGHPSLVLPPVKACIK